MKDFLKGFGSAVLATVVILLLFFIASGVSQRFTGKYTGFFDIGYAEVVSPSMTPNILVGDMIIYQKQPVEELGLNDVIVYVRDQNTPSEKLIVHRIVEINEDGIITQGDANTVADDPERMGEIIGRVVFRIPYIGNAAEFVKTPIGFLCVAGGMILIIVLNLVIIAILNRKHPIKTVNGDSFIEY